MHIESSHDLLIFLSLFFTNRCCRFCIPLPPLIHRHRPPGGLNLPSIQVIVIVLWVICCPPSPLQVLLSGDEGAAFRGAPAVEVIAVWGAGWLEGLSTSVCTFTPPHCSGPTGRPPRESVWWSLLLQPHQSLFFWSNVSNNCEQGWG